MTVVLDTSAAFEIAFNGPDSERFKKIIADADMVMAPDFFDAEVTNVLWKYVKAGNVDEENAQKTLLLMLQMVDDFTPTAELGIEALHESIRLNHPVYDMYYFVQARRHGATLLTEDNKLKVLCLDNGIKLG